MEEKNEKKEKSFSAKIGASMQSKGFRSGLYATIITVFVIVAVVIVNLIVSALDIKKDLTADKTNSITDTTKELLDTVEEEVEIYFLTKNNATFAMFDTIFEEYEKHCDRIDFQIVDLMLTPDFAEKYTDKTVEQYSVIVACEATGMSKYVAYSDLFITEFTMDYSTYETYYQPVALDLEGQLNAAIQYVISGRQTHFYAVTGHGEKELGTEGQNVLHKANIVYHTLATLTVDAIPEDCDVLYIAAPTVDFSDAELAMIRAYAAEGGKIMLVAGSKNTMTNVAALYADYGVQVENGMVIEGDTSAYVPGTPTFLLPQAGEHEILNTAVKLYVSMPYAYALKTKGNTDTTLKISALLTSTASSYMKTVTDGGIKTTEKEEGDVEGPFTLGMYVENAKTGAEAVIVSSAWTFDDVLLQNTSYGNVNLLTNSINYMADAEMVSTVRTISLTEEETLVITAAEALTLGFVCVILLPVLLLAGGITVLLVRRRK